MKLIVFLMISFSIFSEEKDRLAMDIVGYDTSNPYCIYHGIEKESGMKVFYVSTGECQFGKVAYCYGWETFDSKNNRWNGEGTCRIRNE